YFNLKPSKDHAYFPTEEILLNKGISIPKDSNYKSIEAQNRDLAYRAFQSGFISKNPQKGIDIWKQVNLPIEDEYRFILKNFSKIWGIYILLIRLLTLKNPLKEINGFLKAGSTKR